jgi:hypothetical protein
MRVFVTGCWRMLGGSIFKQLKAVTFLKKSNWKTFDLRGGAGIPRCQRPPEVKVFLLLFVHKKKSILALCVARDHRDRLP